MRAQDIIAIKRDGGRLSAEAIGEFVDGVVGEGWTRAQAASLLMAIVVRGMDAAETGELTRRMLGSGERLTVRGGDRLVADKHSTGGVGDKVSLILAPVAACCGLAVPMLSGRGLGHTGGTLDKLEAIPGFRTQLSREEMEQQVASIGCVIAGQTEHLVPADRILYGLRDETGTVESIPLIASSILSKKWAEDLDGLVMDIKVGSGAFMADVESARELAGMLVSLGREFGCPVRALLTDMDRPLGQSIGNAVEVAESIEQLQGRGSDRLRELVVELVAGMLVVTGKERDLVVAREQAAAPLRDGRALACFARMVEAQGGDARVVESPRRLPRAGNVVDLLHEEPEPVWVADVDARALASVVLETGAGRRRASDAVNLGTGISRLAEVGERLEPGDLLGRLHHDDPQREAQWVERIRGAVRLSHEEPARRPLILECYGDD